MTIYNQSSVSVFIDGVEQRDLAEGDSIVVSYSTDYSTLTPAGAGSQNGSLSLATDRSGTITITYKNVSESLELVRSLKTAQELGIFTPVDIIVAGGSQDFLNAFKCSLQTMGDMTTGGPVHGNRAVIFNSTRITEI